MATLTERSYEGDIVLYMQPFYSVDAVTIAAGADLAAGHVLGRVTDTGKYVSSDPGAADGSETPAAVLLEDAAAAAADATEVRALTRHAAVNAFALVYDAAIDTDAERATARAALEAAGIVTRF